MEKLESNRVAIKVGTNVLTSFESSGLHTAVITELASQIHAIRAEGISPLLISSGSVQAGRALLGSRADQETIVDKQLLAAVGQRYLTRTWDLAFQRHNITLAEFLLSEQHLFDSKAPLNLAMEKGLLPLLNGNDAVNSHDVQNELNLEDNDAVLGLASEMIRAKTCIILTNTDGVLDDSGHVIQSIDASADFILSDHGHSMNGTGGMKSKVKVGIDRARAGVDVFIINGREPNVIYRIMSGARIGTHISIQ